MNYFSKLKLDDNSLQRLADFNGRDGFVYLTETDFEDMQAYFSEYKMYEHLLPLLTDENSNYCCVYTSGCLQGMVCYLAHDEPSLEPRFRTVERFVHALEDYPDAYDFTELPPSVFDFPIQNEAEDFDQRKETLVALWDQLEQATEETQQQQLAYATMALSTVEEIETYIYPFLQHEDDYIQERAIALIGFHQYQPAKELLIQLTKTASANVRAALGKTLKALKNKSK